MSPPAALSLSFPLFPSSSPSALFPSLFSLFPSFTFLREAISVSFPGAAHIGLSCPIWSLGRASSRSWSFVCRSSFLFSFFTKPRLYGSWREKSVKMVKYVHPHTPCQSLWRCYTIALDGLTDLHHTLETWNNVLTMLSIASLSKRSVLCSPHPPASGCFSTSERATPAQIWEKQSINEDGSVLMLGIDPRPDGPPGQHP